MGDLQRFIEAQDSTYAGYATALQEIKQGRKTSPWIWYIFPQIQGLGHSYNARYYALEDIEEAKAYLKNEMLNHRLREITEALLSHKEESVQSILGGIDAIKICSCMTLFNAVSPNDIFKQVIDTFYNGKLDNITLSIITPRQHEQ